MISNHSSTLIVSTVSWETITSTSLFDSLQFDIVFIESTNFICWMLLLRQAMRVYAMAKALGRPAARPAVYRTFSTNHLSYTKILVPIYIFRAIAFFGWCHHFLRKNGLLHQNKNTLSWAVFREALLVAPPFLDMCLDIYGAWINRKQSFDSDIILENIAFFAKNGFLKQ